MGSKMRSYFSLVTKDKGYLGCISQLFLRLKHPSGPVTFRNALGDARKAGSEHAACREPRDSNHLFLYDAKRTRGRRGHHRPELFIK